MYDEVQTETLAETENYEAWISHEPDGESVLHLDLGVVTLHFFKEEWDELLQLIGQAHAATQGQGKQKPKRPAK